MYGNPYDDYGKSAYDIGDPSWKDDEYLAWILNEGEEESHTVEKKHVVTRDDKFYLNLLQGRIAQSIVEGVFRKFNFEVFPYGYESYLTNVIKSLSKSDSNHIVKKLRCTPDCIIYDTNLNEANLLEIKSTRLDIDRYWLSVDDLNKYKTHWPEALLTILHTPTFSLFFKVISDLDTKSKVTEESGFHGNDSRMGYRFDLNTEFESIETYFASIPNDSCVEYLEKIKIRIKDTFNFR